MIISTQRLSPSAPVPRPQVTPSGPQAPTDAFVPTREPAPAAPSSPNRYAAILCPTLPDAFRAPIIEALDALPATVSEALKTAGYQIAVATKDGPPPFAFTPYPVDALARNAARIAEHPPEADQKMVIDGARVVTQRCDPYQTFDDLARQRGATSPQEIGEMADLARALNPTLEVRGELPMGRQMYIPDYYYWRGERVPTQAWVALTQEEQGIAGTTFDKQIPFTDAPQKLILMSESAFKESTPLSRFYLHHEIGHAVVDVLNRTKPDFGTRLHADMTVRMAADRAAHTLLRPYSGSEPDEFIADAFAARFLAPPPAVITEQEKRQASLCGETLRANDPQAWQLASQMVVELD